MARRRKPTGSPGYIPPKERREVVKKAADKQLDRFIKDKYESTKNQEVGVKSIVQDMPKKFADNFINSKGEVGPELDKNGNPIKSRYYRADGSLNSAGLATLAQYTDERPEYSRQLNRLRTFSPQMMDAFARRFPKTNFAMKAGPMIAGAVTGVPFGLMDLYNRGKDKFTNLSDRDDILGAIARTTNDIASSFTAEQAKNIDTNIEAKKPIDQILRNENIVNASTDVDPILSAATAQTGAEGIVDIFDNDGEKAAIDASLPTGNIVYNPYNSNPYSPGSREYNEFEEFKKFKESQEKVDDSFEGVEDGVFQRAGEFKLEADEPSVNLSGVTDYEEEFEDTFGVPMKGNIEAPSLTRPGEIERGLGDRLTRETFALDNNIPLDQLGEVYPKTTSYPVGDMRYGVFDKSSLYDADQLYDGETNIPYGTVYSDKVSDTPKLGQEIRGFNIKNPSLMPGGDANIFLSYPGGIGLDETFNMVNTINRKDGGSTDNYGNMSTHEKLMRMASKMYG